MSSLIYIFFVLYGLIPTRLLALGNLDPFSVVVFLVYLPALRQGIEWARSPEHGFFLPSRRVALILLALLVSYIHMVLDVGSVTSWIPIWVMNYALFWVFLREVDTIEKIRRIFSWLAAFNVVGMGLMALFFLHPTLLEGPLHDVGMGSFRGYTGEIPRVFTPAMAYVALGVMYGLSYLFYARHRGRQIAAVSFVVASVVAISVFTSVRAYLLAIAVGVVVLIFARFSWRIVARAVAWGSLALALLVVMLPDAYYDYVWGRVSGPLKSTDQWTTEDMVVPGEHVYSTVYWRLIDAAVALDLVQTPTQVLFGRMGYKYDVPGVEGAMAPHISLVGIFYLFGVFGVACFLGFALFFTRHLIQVVRLYRDRDDLYLAAFLLAAWIMLFVISIAGGGVYYAPECAAVATICALSVILKQLALAGSITSPEHGTPHDHRRYAVAEPGKVH